MLSAPQFEFVSLFVPLLLSHEEMNDILSSQGFAKRGRAWKLVGPSGVVHLDPRRWTRAQDVVSMARLGGQTFVRSVRLAKTQKRLAEQLAVRIGFDTRWTIGCRSAGEALAPAQRKAIGALQHTLQAVAFDGWTFVGAGGELALDVKRRTASPLRPIYLLAGYEKGAKTGPKAGPMLEILGPSPSPSDFPWVGHSITAQIAHLDKKPRPREVAGGRALAQATLRRCDTFYLLRPRGGGAFDGSIAAARKSFPTATMVMDGFSYLGAGGTEIFSRA